MTGPNDVQSGLGPLRWTLLGMSLVMCPLLFGTGVTPVNAEEPVATEAAESVAAEGCEPATDSPLEGLASLDPMCQEAALQTAIKDIAFLNTLEALNDGTLHVWKIPSGTPTVVITRENIEADGRESRSLFHPLTGEELGKHYLADVLPEGEEVERVRFASPDARRIAKDGLNLLKLKDPDVDGRRTTAVKLGNAGNPAVLPDLEEAFARETDEFVRHDLEVAIGRMRLLDPDPEVRQAAAVRLGEIKGMRAKSEMKALLTEEPKEPSEKVQAALRNALEEIESYEKLQGILSAAFNGISLGSVLFMLGLGLAITYGLMGIINMAHGEMLMIGAYTAFVMQEIFAAYLPPTLGDYYYFTALPVSFVVTGAVGLLIERSVLRFLYGRPLETLLATWGIGMFLQQAARWYFGDLTSVNTPTFLRRGIEPMVGLVLPYTRIFVILLACVVLLGVYLLFFKTRVGLLVRSVTQNRSMSACVGISTRKVDSWTFALGTGLAGMAGCAISLIGSVDPEIGKTYIVEAFMVVVVGGVGKLAGTVVSSMGIGVLNKILEPIIAGTGGAIYSKLFILGAVILFLQVRPTGLFPAKGRAAEVGA